MSKFDLSSIVESLKASCKDDKRKAAQFGLGSDLDVVSTNPKDFVVMPDWWEKYYGIKGLPFGKWVQISGKPDAGKTSLCLLAMKCAQEQGYGIIYAETERKTFTDDLTNNGIDPEGVLLLKTNLTEYIFDGVNANIDMFFDKYPNEKLLLVIDSYGNTTSMRDSEINMTEKAALMGGAAKSNRMGIGSLVARQNNHDIAVLIVNYSYDNIKMGRGEINAGGTALEFACTLIINARRRSNYERTVKGVKVRAGIFTTFKTTKNHFAKTYQDKNGKAILLPKELVLKISADGMEPQEK